MKKLFTLLLLGGTLTVNAQQVNGSFDDVWEKCIPWTSSNNTKEKGTQPIGWTISNVIGVNGLGATQVGFEAKSSDLNTAVQLINTPNTMSKSQIVPAYITLGTSWATSKGGMFGDPTDKDGGSFGGVNFTYRPDAIKFSYKRIHGKSNPQEKATVVAYIWKGTYTQYDVPGENSLGSPKTTTMYNRDRHILNMNTSEGGSKTQSAEAECIAKLEYYIEGEAEDWKELTVPFTYTSDNQPEMLNIIFAANEYFNESSIGNGNELWLDDVTLVYNSQLSSLIYNGNLITDFSSDKYEYTIAEDYQADQLVATSNGKGATIEQYFNPITALLTITVKGNDWSENNLNEHTYKIQFNKPKSVKNYTNSLFVDASAVGTPIFPPTQETIQLIENANGSISFYLQDFSFAGQLMGDILMTDLNKEEGGNGEITYTQTQMVYISGMQSELPVTLTAVENKDQMTANISIMDAILVTFAPALNIDGQSAVVVENAGLHNVTLSRTFPAGWSTICLPFATTTAAFGEEVKAQEFASADDNGLNFEEVTKLDANKPYLIYFPSETTTPVYLSADVKTTTPESVTFGDFTFCGSYEASISMAGKYGVADQGNVQKLMLGGEGSTLKATRAYFTKSGDQPAMININLDGNATGIENIEQNQADIYDVYNLQGQLIRKNATSLNGLAKGIYIVNGKKVMVK